MSRVALGGWALLGMDTPLASYTSFKTQHFMFSHGWCILMGVVTIAMIILLCVCIGDVYYVII